MTRTGSGRSPVNKARGQTSHRNATAKSQSASAHICTERATWLSGSSTRSSNVGALQPDMTNLRPTTLPSSSSRPFGFGYALMSPRPNALSWDRKTADIYDVINQITQILDKKMCIGQSAWQRQSETNGRLANSWNF